MNAVSLFVLLQVVHRVAHSLGRLSEVLLPLMGEKDGSADGTAAGCQGSVTNNIYCSHLDLTDCAGITNGEITQHRL